MYNNLYLTICWVVSLISVKLYCFMIISFYLKIIYKMNIFKTVNSLLLLCCASFIDAEPHHLSLPAISQQSAEVWEGVEMSFHCIIALENFDSNRLSVITGDQRVTSCNSLGNDTPMLGITCDSCRQKPEYFICDFSLRASTEHDGLQFRWDIDGAQSEPLHIRAIGIHFYIILLFHLEGKLQNSNSLSY